MTAQKLQYSVFELQINSWLKAIENPYSYVGLQTFASKEEVDTAYDQLQNHLQSIEKKSPLEISKKLIHSFQEIHELMRDEAHQLRDLSSPEEKDHIFSKKRHTDHLAELRMLKKMYSVQYPDRLGRLNSSLPIINKKFEVSQLHSGRLINHLHGLLYKPFISWNLPEFTSPDIIQRKFEDIIQQLNKVAHNNPDDKVLQKAVNIAFWYGGVISELSKTISTHISSHFPDIHAKIQKSTDKKKKRIAIKLIIDNIHTLPEFKNVSKLKDFL